jgi:hypothetical protein
MSTATSTPIPTLKIIEGPEWKNNDHESSWHFPHHAYTIRLTHDGRTMETPWRQGTAITHDPETHDVIGCLLMEAQGIEACTTFPDWAEDYGYDSDSIKARGLYDLCHEQTAALETLLGRPLMNALMKDDDATYGAAPRFILAWNTAVFVTGQQA